MPNSVGIVVMATVCFIIGLAGVAGFWAATKARVPGTSPLMQLFTLALSVTFIWNSILMWRRSRLAAPAFLVAIVFPVIVARNLVPSGALFVPSVIVAALVGFPVYRYLSREGDRFAAARRQVGSPRPL